jgi:hypothetical protein
MSKEIPHPFITKTCNITAEQLAHPDVLPALFSNALRADIAAKRGSGTPPALKDIPALAEEAHKAILTYPDSERCYEYATVFLNTEDAFKFFLHSLHIVTAIPAIDNQRLTGMRDGFMGAAMIRVSSADSTGAQDPYILSPEEVDLYIEDFIQRCYDLGYFNGVDLGA